MKISILFGSAVLLATALTPVSAYADDQSFQCRRSGNGCDSRNGGGNGKLSISGFDIDVKTSDRGNRNRNNAAKDTRGNDSVSEAASAHNSGNHSDNDSPSDADDTDSNDAGNEDADAGDNDTGTDNTDTGASNNPPLQSNSNDIKGFDPFNGLYGPGT